MAIRVEMRTFFILAALLGLFITIKAQEEEDYDAGEFFSPFFLSFFFLFFFFLCKLSAYCVIWLMKEMENFLGDFWFVCYKWDCKALSLGI